MSDWVYVSDRLPNKKEQAEAYIVYDAYLEGITVGYLSNWFKGFETYANRDDCAVIAWKMIPTDLPEGLEERKEAEIDKLDEDDN